jgi:hypothetical protein
MVDDNDDEPTSLDVLSDYECPECGPVVDPDDPLALTEDEASVVLGGDANGFLRCPNDWCGEELEQTLAARVDMLEMIAERLPELAGEIEQRVAAAFEPPEEATS